MFDYAFECRSRVPHRKSQEKYELHILKNQLRVARNFVLSNARKDSELNETICLKPSDEVKEHLQKTFKGVHVSAYDFDLGDVLEDGRGRGTCQQFLQYMVTFVR